MELADTAVSNTAARDGVGVRVSPDAPSFSPLLVELADTLVLETSAVKSVGVRVSRGGPSFAVVMEQADNADLKPAALTGVQVRILPAAPV